MSDAQVQEIMALLEPMHQIPAPQEPNRECDDCGIEDGARWDIGPNNQWSVCTGCKDSYGYDN